MWLIAGAVTNNDGFYIFVGLLPGRYELRASFVGFRPYVDTLTIDSEQLLSLNFSIEPAAAELGEVVVAAGGLGGAADVIAGRQIVDPADIDLIPAPDVAGDLVNYLSAHPGSPSTWSIVPKLVKLGDVGVLIIRLMGFLPP